MKQFSPQPVEVEDFGIVWPSAFLEFVLLKGNAIRLGLWPAEIYAGRLTVWGERVECVHLPRCGETI